MPSHFKGQLSERCDDESYGDAGIAIDPEEMMHREFWLGHEVGFSATLLLAPQAMVNPMSFARLSEVVKFGIGCRLLKFKQRIWLRQQSVFLPTPAVPACAVAIRVRQLASS